MEVEASGTTMLCCVCGSLMQTNPARMCLGCLRTEVSATDEIPKQLCVSQCKHCMRYAKPPWVTCEWESKELLALCLKKIKGLNKLRLVDAAFLYSEPHSRRLKVRIVVQREILRGAIVEAPCIIQFVIQSEQCQDCQRSFTPHTWNAQVQVRQRAAHKKTLFYLEQIILKRGAQQECVDIEEAPDGIDFRYREKSHAERMAHFVASQFPTKLVHSKKLISEDEQNSTHYNKYTIVALVAPVCRDDIVFLPPKASRLYGGQSLLLVTRLSTAIHLVDPFTLRGLDVAAEMFFKHPFDTVVSSRRLIPFIVLDVEPVDMQTVATAATAKKHLEHSRFRLVDVIVARMSDFGRNDQQFTTRSHLGHHMKPMDVMLGYDLSTLNLSGADEARINLEETLRFDVVLVKKAPSKQRPHWLLQTLRKGGESAGPAIEEVEEFKADIDADEEMKKSVNRWRDPRRKRRPRHAPAPMADDAPMDTATDEPTADDEEEEADTDEVCRLLDGLTIDDLQTTM